MPETTPPGAPLVSADPRPTQRHAAVRKTIQLRKRIRPSELFAEIFIRGVAFLSFAVILLIFLFVFKESIPASETLNGRSNAGEELQQETYGEPSAKSDLREIPQETDERLTMESLTGTEWQPVSSKPKFGIFPLIIGTLKVTIISVLIGAPLAILAALYTSFFAPRRLREFLKPAIEFLSGFPSVVIGFFALVDLATLVQRFFGAEYRLNAFVGGVALSLAVIPIVFSVTEDALSSIPKYFTEASLALGATKWQTALFVVLPAATPGVFAAMLLGVGRAFGETMIVLMATGNAALWSWKIFEPVRTMSATIGAEMAEVVFGDVHYSVLFLIGSILFLFTFALNAVAEFYVRARLQKRFRGVA